MDIKKINITLIFKEKQNFLPGLKCHWRWNSQSHFLSAMEFAKSNSKTFPFDLINYKFIKNKVNQNEIHSVS